jgi:CheY-like chemotaxis protein
LPCPDQKRNRGVCPVFTALLECHQPFPSYLETTLTATGGEQAIHYLEGKGIYEDRSMHPLPDVLVLDLKMPRVDGFAFLAWRRDSPAISMIPVMIFSGLEDKEEIERALALGASHFLAKPHNFQGYKEVVQAVWEFGIKRSGSRGISRSAA